MGADAEMEMDGYRRLAINIVLLVVTFIPCQYALVFAHEYGHGLMVVLLGGRFNTVYFSATLFGSGTCECGGACVPELAMVAGAIAMVLVGIAAARFGLWPVAIGAGTRVIGSAIGSTVPIYTASDFHILYHMGTPLAYVACAIVVAGSGYCLYAGLAGMVAGAGAGAGAPKASVTSRDVVVINSNMEMAITDYTPDGDK